jgi:hypothetical protein
MNMSDPIDPVKCGEPVFAINGNPINFPADMIPKLFVAYVAAVRAEYYAGVDAARCDTKEAGWAEFDAVFDVEVKHALRDRSEIKDWMENNMDVHLEPCAEIGCYYKRLTP